MMSKEIISELESLKELTNKKEIQEKIHVTHQDEMYIAGDFKSIGVKFYSDNEGCFKISNEVIVFDDDGNILKEVII